MRLAVIPARGGSKRIPFKNIKSFAGKPMLAYAIAVAKESGLFDGILVSSDDAQTLLLAEQFAATPLKRPDTLADDHTPTVPVVAHAITACANWGWEPESVCCIYPAVPFLQAQLLQQALVLLDQKPIDYVFPIIAYSSPIQRALRLEEDGKLTAFYAHDPKGRTQDLAKAYYDAGQFYWGKVSAWLEGKPIHSHGYGLEISPWQAIDIDTPDDWARAELMQHIIQLKEVGDEHNQF